MTIIGLWLLEHHDTLATLLRALLAFLSGGEEATGPWLRS